jgi:outer membrane protein assembly factor BamB
LTAAVNPQATAPHARTAVSVVAAVLGALMAAAAFLPVQRFDVAASPGDSESSSAATWPSSEELARNWPGFRGALCSIAQTNIPSDWDGPSGRNIVWKSHIPLPGRNSPIVWNDVVLISGATPEHQNIYCYDAVTGSLRWQRDVGNPNPLRAPKVMQDTGYAASTMVTDGRCAYAIFANGDVVALSLTGDVAWTRNLGVPDNQYGHASSLAVWRDRLIVQLDQGLDANEGKSALLALDAATGRPVWKTPRPVPNSWTSPVVVSTRDGGQIIAAAQPWVIAYEPERGHELWRAKCLDRDVAPSPAVADDLVYVAQEGSDLSAIRLGGSGDVTSTHIAWKATDGLPDIISPLAAGQFVLLVTSAGTVSCYDSREGKFLWEHHLDGSFHASPLLVGDVVHLIGRDGVMHRFRLAAEFSDLQSSALGEPVSATPAVAGGRIFIRGESNLYCIGSN